jgi:ELWxxDGT repeat protein
LNAPFSPFLNPPACLGKHLLFYHLNLEAMKKILLIVALFSILVLPAYAQVTRLSNNTSYDLGFALTDNLIVLRSSISKTIWVYNIAGNSFTQLSSAVTVEQDYGFGFMNSKLYFAGKTVAEGIELWVTDGTPGGTTIVKNINPAAADSDPKYGFTVYNNEIYFTADDGTNGRELWKSNGTGAGTVLVKNINAGAADAFPLPGPGITESDFKVINSVLVFSATTAADGQELWKTDGTDPGTTQLKNIYTTATYGSYISSFTEYGSNLLFQAFDETNGDAIWKTDGTSGGTVLVKDINPSAPFPPPFYYFFSSVTPSFFNFQGTLYFIGDDGTNGYELWKTDGTTGGTSLVKDINPGSDDAFPFGFPQLTFAVKNSSKFFFSANTAAEGTELWESDGTGSGTQLLKDIATGAGVSSEAFILPNFFNNGLFQGNKFFLMATTAAEGNELYVSDGTAGGTTLLKDINPGPSDGLGGFGYVYTDNKLYFVANNGTQGDELSQSDATGTGTTIVADVNVLPSSAGSDIQFATVASNTLFFFGTDGDDAVNTDFFKLDAPVSLPLRWVSIEARPRGDDVLLVWKTALEEHTGYFVVQRSADGISYTDVGRVNASGGISNNYNYTDAGAMKQAGVKKWFYRVRCVDIDGKSSISKIVTVALNKTITRLSIIPNPVVHELKLLIDATENGRAVMRCMDMAGKEVLQKTVDLRKGENTIISDARKLPAGTYVVQVFINGSITAEHFLIQH